MITCVQKDTHTKKIDRPNRIGKFVPRMSNRIKFVNCVGCNSKCYFNSETKSEFFPKIFTITHVRKVQVKKYHCYFVEHSVSKGNNQGTKKNGIPAALKRGQNTKTPNSGTKIYANRYYR